ncbi:PorV/PorQ family protein [Candidatus Amoebophilus asiaticus]|nr:PorV/PorQ family protein [Candidatus Amoebophilus asiaticus]
MILFQGNFAVSDAPKYSNEFLSLGVGARAFGMSNVQVANVSDVTAGFWNPAGLTQIKSDRQIALMHAEYFAGIAKYDYGAIAIPMDSGRCLAITLIRFGVDDIPNTIELVDANGSIDYSKITSFSIADYAFIFSYATETKKEGLSLGANAKIIHRRVGEFAKAWGFGLDAGAQYNLNKWRFGLMAKDITTTFNSWNFTLSDEVKDVWQQTGNVIPENSTEITLPKLILGSAFTTVISPKFSLLTGIDLDLTFDGQRNVLLGTGVISFDPHWGFEIGYKGFIFLRGGMGNYQKILNIDGKKVGNFQPNLGLGLKIKQITLDYALTDIGDQSVALYSHVFSFKIDLNRK